MGLFLVFKCSYSVYMCFIRFPPESVSVCYNGGKDCIVMLHLVHAYFQVLYYISRGDIERTYFRSTSLASS